MHKSLKNIIVVISISTLFLLPLCTKKEEKVSTNKDSKDINIEHIAHIKTMDELKDVLEREQDKLIVLDLYADWCMPCRILS
ncbi:MAG: hypothetical protein N2053_08485, partial [Chitinispirillaceae bacterium]|nr:hypothetical protein [Chitinispirillaceae bacterium]